MNSFGRIFKIEIFGESHGKALGVLIDGCPPGISIHAEDFEADLARRRAGATGTTPRKEADRINILAGVFNNYTTGAPILLQFHNEDTRSSDYEQFVAQPRPGHADYTAQLRYKGYADMRGSGHFSGRITVGLVAAGVLAKKLLPNTVFRTRLIEAGGDSEVGRAVQAAVDANDSVGGIVEVVAGAVPAGLGNPFFDSVESLVSHLVFAVPAVRGIEFGDGFAAAKMRGSEHNDPFVDNKGHTSKNGAGGINGGITNGNPIVMRVAIKPTSTIGLAQNTYNFKNEAMAELAAAGRHDACIAIRAAVVIESCLALALADLVLLSKTY